MWRDSCWLTVTLSLYNKGGRGTLKVVKFWRPPHLHVCPPHLQCDSEGLLLKRGPRGPAGFRSTKSVHVFVALTSSDWLQPLGPAGQPSGVVPRCLCGECRTIRRCLWARVEAGGLSQSARADQRLDNTGSVQSRGGSDPSVFRTHCSADWR